MKDVDTLRRELKALETERYRLEMSDDFCFTNGRLARADAAIRAKAKELKEAEKQADE